MYLHVGPPKTGTTYLQDVLWRNQRALADRGVVVPGRQVDHFHAALDLRGIAFGGHEHPDVPGAWERLAGRVSEASADTVVLSHEVFAGAQPDQIERGVSDLSPADVHVVYAARDLGRQLPAVWQEGLKNRQTRSYRRFLERSLRPGAPVDRGFWRAQHPVAVLGRWAEHIPRERIHLVTLPPASASGAGDLLWQRFCAALGIDGSGLDLDVARSNASLSAAQCEVLRRLNSALPDELSWPAYESRIKRRFNALANAGPQGPRGPRVKVPPVWRDEVERRADEIVRGLEEAAYRVVGDLDDLRPEPDAFGPAGVKAAKVTDAAVTLLAAELVEPESTNGARGRARSLMDRFQGRRR